MKRLLCTLLTLLLCATCVACAPASAPTEEPPSTATSPKQETQEQSTTAPQQEKGSLWVDAGDKKTDRSYGFSENAPLILNGSYSAYSGDTVFSGVKLSAVELTAFQEGTLTLAAVSCEAVSDPAKAIPVGGVTLTLKEGVNLLPLSLEIPYGHTLMLGQKGDSAILSLSSDATGATACLPADEGALPLAVTGRFFTSSRLTKNLTGLDLAKEVNLNYLVTDYYYSDEGPLVFADAVADNTRVTKIKAAISVCEAGDTLTVNVVKMDLCNGQTVGEPLSTHRFSMEKDMEDEWVELPCDIEVPKGYTLSFQQADDGALLGYVKGKLGRTNYFRSLGFFHHCAESSNYEGLRHYLLVELHGTPLETAEECALRLAEEQKLVPLSAEEKKELNGYLSGKSLSLLGDSITTYADVSNNTKINTTIGNNAVYYSPTERLYLGQTWWKLLMGDTGLSLCVNNSWSGSLILGGGGNIWSGRSENLHIDTDYAVQNNLKAEPEVILVWMGTNDYNGNAPLGDPKAMNPDLIREENGTFVYAEPTTVVEAYAVSLHKMLQRYPDAQIFLMTPFCIKAKNDPASSYLATFNAALKAVGDSYSLPFINLAENSGIDLTNNASFTHGDGLHPNEKGMAAIANCVERAMLEFYRSQG